jgi:hypothetical protein
MADEVDNRSSVVHVSSLVLVFLNANRKNPQAHRITIVAFHPKVFRVSYVPQGTDVFL